MTHSNTQGFTLIEVLLALSILAIALTALLKSSTNSIVGTQRIKEKTLSHTVAMQGMSMVQLNMVPLHLGQETTKSMTLLGQTWYWHASISKTPIKSVQKITITTSPHQGGPFHDPLIGFQAAPP